MSLKALMKKEKKNPKKQFFKLLSQKLEKDYKP